MERQPDLLPVTESFDNTSIAVTKQEATLLSITWKIKTANNQNHKTYTRL